VTLEFVLVLHWFFWQKHW